MLFHMNMAHHTSKNANKLVDLMICLFHFEIIFMANFSFRVQGIFTPLNHILLVYTFPSVRNIFVKLSVLLEVACDVLSLRRLKRH